MNSLVMIGGVISASIILFMGLSIEKYLSYIRMILATVGLALVGITLLRDAQTLAQMVISGKGVASVWQLITSTTTTSQKIILFVVPIGLTISGGFLLRKFPKTVNAFSDLVLGMLISSAVIIELRLGFSMNLTIIIASIVGVIALCCHIVFPIRYLIIISSIVGGSLVAYLFSSFYFLPFWVGLIVALLFCATGWATQRHSYHKKIRTERIFSGEEPA